MGMEGFSKREQKIYFKIKNGKIIITVKPEKLEDYKDVLKVASAINDIVTKTGVQMKDICIDDFSGRLEKIEVQDSDFGKMWNTTFIANGKTYVWSNNYESIMFQGFINCLLNIEDEKFGVFKLSPWLDTKVKDRADTKLVLYHNGKKIGWKYEYDQLPAIVPAKDEFGEVMLDSNDKPIYNKKKRMLWVLESVAAIEERLNAQNYPHVAAEALVEAGDDEDRF